jgi:5-methylcytosine-specific restriction endonuclease McrA
MRASFAVAQNMICPYCGRPLPEDLRGTHIDHIIPVRMGGPDDLWNVRLLQSWCNRAKGNQITKDAFEVAKAQGINVWGLARGENWYSPSWH